MCAGRIGCLPPCLTCDGTIGGNGVRDGPDCSECVHAVSVGEKVPAAEHFEVTRLLHIVNAWEKVGGWGLRA